MRRGLPAGQCDRRPLLLLLCFLALLVLAFAAPATGQQPSMGELRVNGRVVKNGVGQPGVEVTLHRVTRGSAGVVGTSRSGTRGEFSFAPVTLADTSDFIVHFTTADYLGVRYFGPALHPGDTLEEYNVEVFDTAAAHSPGNRLRVVRREVMLLPEEGRGWEVNEVLQIFNEESRTLVSDGGTPTWEFGIPEGAIEFEVGEGEISADDVRRMDRRVYVMAPLQPGPREIFLRYRLREGERSLQIPVDYPTDNLNLYVRQPSPPLEARGLVAAGTVTADDISFLRFSAEGPPPGASVHLEWQVPRSLPVHPTAAAVSLVLLFLGLGTVAAFRARRPSEQQTKEQPAGAASEDEETVPAGARDPLP